VFSGTVCVVSTGFVLVKIGREKIVVSRIESAMFIFASKLLKKSMPKRPLKCGWKSNKNYFGFLVVLNCSKIIESVSS